MYAKGAVTPGHARLAGGTTAGTVTVTAYQYKVTQVGQGEERRPDAELEERLHVVLATALQGHLSLGDELRRRRRPRPASTSPYRYVKAY